MYVYWWYETKWNAVKIGKGANPLKRMSQYANYHGLMPDRRSLVKVRVARERVDQVETMLRCVLLDLKYQSVNLRTGSRSGSRELFAIKRGASFGEVSEKLRVVA